MAPKPEARARDRSATLRGACETQGLPHGCWLHPHGNLVATLPRAAQPLVKKAALRQRPGAADLPKHHGNATVTCAPRGPGWTKPEPRSQGRPGLGPLLLHRQWTNQPVSLPDQSCN